MANSSWQEKLARFFQVYLFQISDQKLQAMREDEDYAMAVAVRYTTGCAIGLLIGTGFGLWSGAFELIAR